MRCNNCGYVNEDSALRCIKCNAELGGAPVPAERNSYIPPSGEAFQPAATVSEVTGGGFASAGTQVVGSGVHRRRPEPTAKIDAAPAAAFGGTIPPGAPMEGQGTINPWLRKQPIGYCWLQELDAAREPKEDCVIACTSNEFELTRDNTNPDDHTISSHQALLTRDANGNWYIEDKSTYGTTAIVASRRMKLEEGDVIVLGSSRFLFTGQEPDNQA